ncbi:MAG: hypothetical protein CMO40_04660 [Verrucomicrobiaceae bacterium]|nr:hypothetical protein [Verrucomicrobiaceae bacterium]
MAEARSIIRAVKGDFSDFALCWSHPALALIRSLRKIAIEARSGLLSAGSGSWKILKNGPGRSDRAGLQRRLFIFRWVTCQPAAPVPLLLKSPEPGRRM